MSHTIASPGSGVGSVTHARPRPAWAPLVAGALCIAVLAVGWRNRESYWIAADSGLGYALGPIGLGMMTLLLAYSVRKRWRALDRAGSVRTWFHAHMVLGLLGPTAILLHANFEPGSLNARVALACMLAVSGSGLVGRFIYTRIHYEAFGRKAQLAELRRDAAEGRSELGMLLASSSKLADALEAHERTTLAASGGVLDSLVRAVRARFSGIRLRHNARRALVGARSRSERTARSRALRQYVRATFRVTDYAVWERAFALWHAFHLPLCVLLFAAAVVHVVAVHRY
jgi:hypothetical protein